MKKVYNGHANKSGVYKIFNTTNGRFYFGSCKLFKGRAREHLSALKRSKHSNKYLQHDFNKCGEAAFEFHVVEVVPGEQKNRLLVEQRYISQHYDNQNLCYNFSKKTNNDSRSCFSKSPELTKKRRRQTNLERHGETHWAKTPEGRKHASESLTGYERTSEEIEKSASKRRGRKYSKELAAKMTAKRRSPENRKRMSKWSKAKWQEPEYRKAQIQRFAEYQHDDEAKAKMRKAKRRKKPILILSPENKLHRVYSITHFCKLQGLDKANFHKMIRGKYKQHKGWKRYDT